MLTSVYMIQDDKPLYVEKSLTFWSLIKEKYPRSQAYEDKQVPTVELEGT